MDILPLKELNGVPVNVKIVPKGNPKIRPGFALNPSYITIHNTDNQAKGANAAAHANYLINQAKMGENARAASWHFTVDDVSIYQHIPINEVAWHAGDGGNGTGNRHSLAIEICEHADQKDYKKAEENAIQLAVYLAKKLNIPVANIVPHQHWSGKHCPHKILDAPGGWAAFFNRIKTDYNGTQPPSSRPILKLGSRGDAVKELQQLLNKHGYKLAVDGIFGQKTLAAVKSFQKSKGLVVDGIVGNKTWGALLNG